MIFVTGRTKRSIEDHFDKAYELETELALKHKTEMLETVRSLLPKNINCIYIRQPEALGLGHAVLCAKPVIGDEPFAILLADDLLDANPPVMKQMTDVFNERQCSVIGVLDVPRSETRSLRHRQVELRERPSRTLRRRRREAETRGCAIDAGRRRAGTF